MKKIIPAILAIIGLAVGTGAGMYLKPPLSEIVTNADGDHDLPSEHALTPSNAKAEKAPEDQAPKRRSEKENHQPNASYEYVKLNNQFVVPVVTGPKVTALVVMSLSIEVTIGQKETVFVREPKLRDAFLQVMFNHANSGGFDGEFTSGEKMNDLHGSLYEVALEILGPAATDVLVVDIVRQDI